MRWKWSKRISDAPPQIFIALVSDERVECYFWQTTCLTNWWIGAYTGKVIHLMASAKE